MLIIQVYSFSGKPITRGLYKTKEGKLINADANGAANIGAKSNLNGFISNRLEASLAMPLRVQIDVTSVRRFYCT
ncbi:MAG: hypothetical protein MGG11_11760 [Trichodesmium sp. MAG_R03]|nr:hypothetical protein [Trichodesmium sp. MAG_R03]